MFFQKWLKKIGLGRNLEQRQSPQFRSRTPLGVESLEEKIVLSTVALHPDLGDSAGQVEHMQTNFAYDLSRVDVPIEDNDDIAYMKLMQEAKKLAEENIDAAKMARVFPGIFSGFSHMLLSIRPTATHLEVTGTVVSTIDLNLGGNGNAESLSDAAEQSQIDATTKLFEAYFQTTPDMHPEKVELFEELRNQLVQMVENSGIPDQSDNLNSAAI